MANSMKAIICSAITLMMLLSVIPFLAPSSAATGPLPEWSVHTIYSTNDVGKYNSIGLDSNDCVHVSYHDATLGYLMYATNSSGSWTSMALETGALAGQETSLAVDTNDFVHIVYYNYPNANLKYASNVGGSWTSIGVDVAGNVGRFVSMELDSVNNVHVSYYDQTNGALKYATNAGGSWDTSTVDSLNDVGWYSSIAVDHNDVVHIAYYDNTNGDLRYATNPGGVWSTTSVDTAGTVGAYCSICVDSLNKVHISYWDASTGYLKYATNEEGAWTIGRISDTAMNGLHTDTIVDSEDIVHVTFYDPTDGDLWYANDAFGDWTLGVVDSADNVGRFPAITLDSTDNVYISYYDVTNTDLKYAQQILVEPTSPLLLLAMAGSAQVTLSWTEPVWDGGSTIIGYNIYRGNASGNESLLDTVGLVLSYEDIAVSDGETYWYYVRAVNAMGESIPSNEVSATPMSVPSHPLGLHAISGDAQVMLSWGAPADDGGSPVLYYLIYRGLISGGGVPLTTVYGSTAFLDSGLTNGVTYWYYVTAFNQVGEGAESDQMTGTPITLATAPIGLQAVVGNNSINLSWEAPAYDGGSEITNYNVYRGTSSGTMVPLITLGNVTVHEDLTTEPGVTYWYCVRAVNGAGEGPVSNEASTVVPTIPSEPMDLTADASDGTIEMTWVTPTSDGGSAIMGYHIFRGLASGEEEYLTTVDGTNHTDQGLDNGVEYYYFVTAYNAMGNGSASGEVFATPLAVPSEPSGLQCSVQGSMITLSWTAPADDGGTPITGYVIYRGTESGDGEFLVRIGNQHTYTDAGLVYGQTYWYNVSAVNAVGEGPLSNETNCTMLLVPSAPIGLQAIAGDASVLLTWDAPSFDGGTNITGYDIYRGNASGAEEYLTTVTATNYTDEDVQNGMVYFYYIVSRNSEGAGPISNEASAAPLATPSDPVLSAEAGNALVVLSWTVPSNDGGAPVLGYNIYRGTASGSGEFLAMTGNVLTFTDGGLSNGQTYWYRIKAINQAGEGAASNEVSATPATVPGAPQDLQAMASETAITLTWVAPSANGGSPISHYRVYLIEANEATLLATLGNVLTYVDGEADRGIELTYMVTAANEAGEGPGSEEATATVIVPPTAPLNLSTVSGQGFVMLTWEAPSDDGGSPVTQYSVYRGSETGTEVLLTQVGNVLSFLDDETTDGSIYYYFVTANNSVGESPSSNEAQASLQTTASAPATLNGTSGDGIVLLIWTPPSDDGGHPVTGYKVYRVNESGEAVLLATVTGLGYTDDNVSNGETYAYYIVPTNAAGDGTSSDIILVTPTAPDDDGFDWVFWSHLILFIIILAILIYYAYRRMEGKKEKEGEAQPVEGKAEGKDDDRTGSKVKKGKAD